MVEVAVNYGLAGFLYALPMEMMGDRIRMLRNAKRLSQAKLGELCGVTGAAVSQWELSQAADMKLATFLRLCEILGTDPHYLVFGTTRKGPPPSPSSISSRN